MNTKINYNFGKNIPVMLNDKQCQNCNTKLENNHRFCPVCGQEYFSKNISSRLIFKDFLEGLLSIEAGLFKSIKYLLKKPGFLTREYIAGKRASYVSPLKLYLLISLVYFLILSFNDTKSKVTESPNIHTKTEYDENTSSIEKKFSQIDRELFWVKFNSYLSPMIFFLLPVFAFILKILYMNTKKEYLEHLVFSLHFHSFMFTLLSGYLVLNRFVENNLILIGVFIIVFLYLILAMLQLYKQEVGWVILKFLLLISTYIVVFIFFLVVTFAITVVLF